jgi:hypothetical protein
MVRWALNENESRKINEGLKNMWVVMLSSEGIH